MHRLRQITFGSYGHTLNRRQSISPDGEWIVYDTRNEDTHLAKTDAIEMVSAVTGQIKQIYKTKKQSDFGPGVGAVAFHPRQNKIIFIHGLESCCAESPYSSARRFGAILALESKSELKPDAETKWVHAESRVVAPVHPCFKLFGVLAGGTHAHSWDEQDWISFTYNDAWLETHSKENSEVRDCRTVGFMMPTQTNTHACSPISTLFETQISNFEPQDKGNFLGTHPAFLAATIHDSPSPGSDEISQALEECWVGMDGYQKKDSPMLQKAIAFQGTVLGDSNTRINEVFVCDIPNQREILSQRSESCLALNQNRLAPHMGCQQRRLTFTSHRRYPGIQGARHWLVSSPDGAFLYFLMRDDSGIAQLCRVATIGGSVEQVSQLPHSVDSQISLNTQGTQCAFLSNQQICLVDISTGVSRTLSRNSDHELVGSVQFLHEDQLVCNAYTGSGADRFLQIFVCDLSIP